MAKKSATKAKAEAAPLASIKIAVSRELRYLGPYVAECSFPVPLNLSSVCFVVLLDRSDNKIVDAYMAARPPGMINDVVVYDATDTKRLVSRAIEDLGGCIVDVSVISDYESIYKFCEVNLANAWQSFQQDIELALKAIVDGDKEGVVATEAIEAEPEPEEEVSEPSNVALEEEEEEEEEEAETPDPDEPPFATVEETEEEEKRKKDLDMFI
jgi:hypothetical protein